jgi:ribonucleoside-diphosphate reductase alpha chain
MALEKLPRPKIVPGIIVKVPTACGNMYVQLGYVNNKLFEIFATLGRAGGCAMAYSEGLTRSITTGLRCGVPISEYIDQLKSIRCPNPMPFPREDAVVSCPDAIAKTLAEYGSLVTKDLITIIEGSMKDDEDEDAEEKKALSNIEKLREQRMKEGL